MLASSAGFAPAAGFRGAVVLVLAAAVAAAAGGCTHREGDDESPVTPVVDDDAERAAPANVQFALEDLEIAPGEAQELSVRVEPAGEYRVRFSLLGDSLDASLDRTDCVTDAAGICTVGLVAPTSATSASFRVRATVGTDSSAEIVVAVSSNALGTLKVEPVYSGVRQVKFWVGSAYPVTACADLAGNSPSETQLIDEVAFGYSPILTVPAGRSLAVTVRGEEKVTGCVEIAPLTVHEVREIAVPVADVPLRLAGTELELTLDLTSLEPAWPDLLAPYAATLSDAFIGTSDNDLDALLDAMEATATADAEGANLPLARTSGGWDGALYSHALRHGGERLLRDALDRWLAAGPRQIEREANLVGTVVPVAGVDGKADFSLDSFTGFAPSQAGLPETVLVSWQPDPGDRLLMGLSVAWDPTGPLAEYATNAALRERASATTMAEALSAVVDCTALGEDLQPRAQVALGDCDAECVARVCLSALGTLWEHTVSDTEGVDAKIELSATTDAEVDSRATPIACTGEWVGRVTVGDDAATGSGSVTGETAATEADAPSE